ncbi:MAG: restriction endonuclease [Sphingopyxis granuli]|uniref:restriction endonuclease n=1 Tax=Sphingopyxis granuli TaxID=267128 RepID=UPI003C733FE4
MLRRNDISLSSPNGRPKPRPEQFGLPSSFSEKIYQFQKDQFEKNRESDANFWTIAGMGILGIACYFYFGGWFAFFAPFIPPISLLPYVAINAAVKPIIGRRMMKNLLNSGMVEPAYFGKAEPYLSALSEWVFSQTEAGFGYWRDLKAVEFERAVASFFQRRGGAVQLTKATGDGGVDLILRLGNFTYWCQCKGYAKPVAVGAIRQMAGTLMKSGGDVTAVMFSTNGYTKPALEEAATLGVICVDGLKLTQLAKRVEIASLA